MKLFDILSGRKREFSPLKGNTVRMYTCGPSVYAYSHIGNFRTYLFEDILVKYLKYKGYKVKRVMNITDVEDKAIVAARKEGVSLGKLERGKIREFFSDWDELGMERPPIVARASEHVPQMLKLIEKICRNGYCIEGEDGVYFNVRKFRNYGRLRHLKAPKYFGKAKGEDYSKEGLWDFRLWKKWSRADGPVKWKSRFGEGRPGWHIECSAMAMHYLGESFDIHCGGSDNIYPHHENEIAQSAAASGKPLANFWIHSRHLTIGKRKMSKRTGNVLYVKQLKKMGIKPGCLRFYLISKRYRSPLDFTKKKFIGEICRCRKAEAIMGRLERLSRGKKGGGDGKRGKAISRKLLRAFEGAMDNDLDTALAFRRIFREIEAARGLLEEGKLGSEDAREMVDSIEKIDSVLGVFRTK